MTTSLQAARTAAVVASIGFSAIAVFQVALAFGAPLGRAAWKGTHVRLPSGLRTASAFAALFWVLAAAVVLGRAGFEVSPVAPSLSRWGTWILIGLLPIGAVMNFVSPSRWERYLWGPVALILAALCIVLARAPMPPA